MIGGRNRAETTVRGGADRNAPNAPGSLSAVPSPMLWNPPWPDALAATRPAGSTTFSRLTEVFCRTIRTRSCPCPRSSTASSPDCFAARTLTVWVTGSAAGAGSSGSARAAAPKIEQVNTPAADQAWTRRRCRQSIALDLSGRGHHELGPQLLALPGPDHHSFQHPPHYLPSAVIPRTPDVRRTPIIRAGLVIFFDKTSGDSPADLAKLMGLRRLNPPFRQVVVNAPDKPGPSPETRSRPASAAASDHPLRR